MSFGKRRKSRFLFRSADFSPLWPAELQTKVCTPDNLREFSFYGDIDFIPTEQYSKDDAQRAIDDAKFAVQMSELTIK